MTRDHASSPDGDGSPHVTIVLDASCPSHVPGIVVRAGSRLLVIVGSHTHEHERAALVALARALARHAAPREP